MTVTAKVKKRMIDNGRLVHAIVQGESNATTIVFRIEGEADLVASESLYLYLLYKRPNDQTVQLPILLDYTIEDGVIVASFTPGAYFTAQDGVVEISIIATESTAELGGSGEVTNTLLWSSFPAWLIVASSQLADSSTIIEENVFTQYLAELEALDSEAKGYASDAEEFAKGTRSDGQAVPVVSDDANDNAKYYKNKAKEWACKTGGTVEGAELSAKGYALVAESRANEAEGYAIGTKNGSPAPGFADKNAKDWATKTGSTVDGTNYSAKQYALDAGESASIVAAHAEQIDAIADDLTKIDGVYAKLTEIETVADDIQNVDTVAGSIANVNTVAGDKTNVDAVAGNKTNIDTVAGIASDVTAVAGIKADVEAVADIDDDVSAVASIKTDVSAVAAVASDVSAVADDLTNIDAVNSNKTNIDTVAGISSDVSAVAAIDDEIQAVEDALQDIADVATDLNDEDSAIKAVASDMAGVSAVADDLANIDAVAADLANIDAADEHALEAEGWANGTQNGTPVSSGSPYYENNAKYWADAVPNLNNAITALDHRLENIEQSKGDYIVSSYKDGSITPSGKGKWCVVEGVEGVSRCENNLGKATTSGSAITRINDYSVSVSFDSSFTGYPQICDAIQTVNAHKYLIYFKQTAGTNLRTTNSGIFKYYDAPTIEAGKYYLADGDGTSNALQVTPYTAGVGGSGTFTFFVTDLNIYFGTTDLSFLGATDSAKLATIQRDYPHLLLPSDYGTRIVDWTGNGVRAWARNIFDEVTEQGIIYSTGSLSPSTETGRRSADYSPCKPNVTYYGYFGSTGNLFICWYDSDKNFISRVNIQGQTVQAPSNAYWFKISTDNTYGATYKGDICINVSDSQNGTYTHYFAPNTLSFPSISLKSAGSVRDTLELNVEVSGVAKKRETERIDSVDLGTLNYERTTTDTEGHYRYYADIPTMKIGSYGNVGLLCDRYPIISSTYSASSTGISPHGTIARIFIHIVGMDTLSKEDFKTAMNGVPLYFELADPVVTLSDPIIDNTLLTESGGRLSTVQTGTVVDGIADLGFITL